MNTLQAISVFVRVAEAKSFVAAAKRLGLSPSAASKSVTRLEQRLAVRLLNRTTRSVSLTEDGNTFFERCRHILGQLEDAETAVTQEQSQPRGRLRVLMPPGFGRAVLVPVLAKLAERYEELVVDVEFSGRVVDLAEEGVDVVICIGELRDTRLVARKLCDVRYVVVAAPSYLARYGEPRTPEDLARHRCLGYHIPHTHRYRDWNFSLGKQRLSKHISGRLNMNDGAALLEAAVDGAGIATVASFLVADALRSGKLRVILRDYVSVGPPVWIAYLERRHLSGRIRAFVDFVSAHVPRSTSWDGVLEN